MGSLQLSDCLRTNAPECSDRAATDALFSTCTRNCTSWRRAFPEVESGGSGTTTLLQSLPRCLKRDGYSFPDRARFMGYMARVIRGLIVGRSAEPFLKRGGAAITAQSIEPSDGPTGQRVIDDQRCLDELAKVEPELAGWLT
jgi:hypothetical protein